MSTIHNHPVWGHEQDGMYNCGLYGGSFNPLHEGHVRCLIEAASRCRRLIVVLSCGERRPEIDLRVRYRWLYQVTSQLGNVSLFVLTDTAGDKDQYTEEYWQADAEKVREFAGEPIDVVFCGSDYDENSYWARCYPGAELTIIPRDEISSTAIRQDPLAHWDWLPAVVRPYYTKKVLITGSESTGKSTLTANLARHYNTTLVEEVGRDISERSGTDAMMIPDDFTDILLRHKIRETEALQQANRILFEDTDCLVTLFYLGFLEGSDKPKNQALAEAIAGLNHYDLVLFMEPDIPFVQDGDRSEIIAADRARFSDQLKQIYLSHGYALECVSGDYQTRFDRAVSLVEQVVRP